MITQTVNTLEEVVPYTANYFENIALRNNALVTTVFAQINTVTGQINAELAVFNNYSITISTAAANALASANNAAASAAIATAKANLATAVVIPTTATYSYTQQDWRQSMMSKAEFNAMAAERRANRAGSGFDEFGNATSTAGFILVQEGIYVGPLSSGSQYADTFLLGLPSGSIVAPAVGASKTRYPISSINGVNHRIERVGNYSADYWANRILLPPAPTVLPYTATLTQQQIDSGVIKHADASNSGLIVNGRNLVDTSGWTAGNAATLSAVSGKLRVAYNGINFPYARQTYDTIIGKKYKLEVNNYVTIVNTSIDIFASDGATRLVPETNSGTSSYNSIEFTATTVTTIIELQSTAASTGYSEFDNIAVFPADAISRSDLCFLESWHEDVSEKDFVYPLGNVQYLGTTGDSGTTVAGAFAGSATYSLFSDTWQADSALVGKGYVWSTLSDVNKKAFVANPENNCYLDGDKVIQVRYRMRVVMGWGDSWANVSTQINTAPTTGAISYVSYNNGAVVAKGKRVASADLGSYNTVSTYWGSYNTTKIGFDSGIGYSFKASTSADLSISYDGTSLLLPIALIHRRNAGMMHPVYNPNGTKLASDSLPWHSTSVSFTSIADCFTDSKLLATSGYIGTTTGRSDGIFYDQIHEGDIIDLRMFSQKVEDYNRLIDREFNRLVAGTVRGTEGEFDTKVYSVTATTYTAYPVSATSLKVYTSGNQGTTLPIATTEMYKYIGKAAYFITANGVEYGQITAVVSDGFYVNRIGTAAFGTGNTNLNLPYTIYIGRESTRTKSNTLTHTDILGSPANYPAKWKQPNTGVSGVLLIVAEDGTSLLPTGTTGSDGLATFKLSRKANATPLQVLKSTDSGVTWTALTVTTHYTFSTTTNAITFTAGNIPLATDLIRITYQTHINMATATVNSEVLAIGKGMATMHNLGNYGSTLASSLIGKIPSDAGSVIAAQHGKHIENFRIDPTNIFNSGTNYAPSSTPVLLGSSTSPTVKTFPYLTRSNGKAYLNLVFKEMKYGSYTAPTVVTAASATYTQNMTYLVNIAGCALDGKVIQWIATTAIGGIDWSFYGVSPIGVIYLLANGAPYTSARLYDGDSWGDDSKFDIVDNISTTVDTNGATVLIGQKRVELPYFIDAKE